MVDGDKDGTLNKAEMANAMQMMQKMRASGAAPPAPKTDAGARCDDPAAAINVACLEANEPRRATGGVFVSLLAQGV